MFLYKELYLKVGQFKWNPPFALFSSRRYILLYLGLYQCSFSRSDSFLHSALIFILLHVLGGSSFRQFLSPFRALWSMSFSTSSIYSSGEIPARTLRTAVDAVRCPFISAKRIDLFIWTSLDRNTPDSPLGYHAPADVYLC